MGKLSIEMMNALGIKKDLKKRHRWKGWEIKYLKRGKEKLLQVG